MPRSLPFAPGAILAAALVPNTSATAQNLQPWPTLQLSVPIAPRVSLSGETVQRISADDRRAGQWRLRANANYNPSKRLALSVGYGRLVTYQSSGANGLENQINEQASWEVWRIASIRLLSRTRLEERFIRGDDGTSWRLREQLRGELPLGRHAASLVLWTEPFVVVHHTRLSRDTLSMIRTFVGVSAPLSRRVSVEGGYLN